MARQDCFWLQLAVPTVGSGASIGLPLMVEGRSWAPSCWLNRVLLSWSLCRRRLSRLDAGRDWHARDCLCNGRLEGFFVWKRSGCRRRANAIADDLGFGFVRSRPRNTRCGCRCGRSSGGPAFGYCSRSGSG